VHGSSFPGIQTSDGVSKEETMNGKRILILGGGVGGIVTANTLQGLLDSKHTITVVDRQVQNVYAPSLIWVMVGWRRPEQITRDLRYLVRPEVEVVEAAAQEIDLDGQKVKTNGSDLPYDYLVLALGANLAPDAMPGFAETAHTPYDLEGAAGLWSALQKFEGGRVAVAVSSMPYKCPAAPYETAMLLDDHLRRHGIRDRCQVEIYTPEVLPMGVAGPAMGNAVVSMLDSKDIRFNPQLTLTHIDPEANELAFSNHEPAPFDLLAGVPPHRPPQVVKNSALSNEAGWALVNKRTMQTTVENVYAIGDVTAVTLANGMALPKAGVFADGQAQTVARRIADDIHKNGQQAEFDGLGFCWIESGAGSAGFASGEFYSEPNPLVPLPRSGRMWHWGKILFEKYWLNKGLTRQVSKLGLEIGSRLLGIPTSL
jgi:sulfide:quinone oxidoreductase